MCMYVMKIKPIRSTTLQLAHVRLPPQIGVGDGGGVFVPDVSHLDALQALVADPSPSPPAETHESDAAKMKRLEEENIRLRRVLQCGYQLLLQATMPTMGEEVRLDEFAGICMRTMNREAKMSD